MYLISKYGKFIDFCTAISKSNSLFVVHYKMIRMCVVSISTKVAVFAKVSCMLRQIIGMTFAFCRVSYLFVCFCYSGFFFGFFFSFFFWGGGSPIFSVCSFSFFFFIFLIYLFILQGVFIFDFFFQFFSIHN